MSTIPAKTAFAVLGFAVILFLSCSDYPRQVFPGEDTFPPLSSETVVSSSSSGEVDGLSSSSGGGVDGSSSSGGEVDGSSSSNEEVSCDDVDKCGGKCYNKETQFCINKTTIYDKCDGDIYNVTSQICCGNGTYQKSLYSCKENVLLMKCGAEGLYNPQEEFCASDDIAYPLCNGKQYDPNNQNCITLDGKDVIIGSCGTTETLNYDSYFCYNATPYELCGGKDYRPTNQFCYNKITVKDKCGGKDYDPSTHFCYEDVPYKLCDGKDYDPSTHFCYEDVPYKLCDTKKYNPSAEGCCKTNIYPLKKSHYEKDKEQFCDERDGKTYVKMDIGTQTWMAENLNYRTSDNNSRCYPIDGSGINESSNNNDNCNIYGRLYNWKTAMNNATSSNANPSGVVGVCPSGWHLPSHTEWETLISTVGGNLLAGKTLKVTDYNGTDDHGFSALLGGGSNNANFSGVGSYGYWWSSRESSDTKAYYLGVSLSGYAFGNYSSGDKSSRLSVRCVKD